MAITKITYLGDSNTSFSGKRLRDAISYITNPAKTRGGELVDAVNCVPGTAFAQMMGTKRDYEKTGQRQGYHIVISFKGSEATPETAFDITGRFAEEYLGKNYEAVYSVHGNTDNIHSHIVFNSVRWTDGRKYRYEKGDWAKHIQPLTNRLCAEHGLSTIDIEASQQKGAERYERSEGGKRFGGGAVQWSQILRNDIDACIALAYSYEKFVDLLIEKGYEIKNAYGEGKYMAVRPPGRQRYQRLATLGGNYTEERIRKRILTDTVGTLSFSYQSEGKADFFERYPDAPQHGFQQKHYDKLCHIAKLGKGSYSHAWKHREDIMKMKALERQYLFIVRHDIKSEGELDGKIAEIAERKKAASAEKGKAYREARKYRDLFDAAHAMTRLEPMRVEYERGDSFFRNEYEQWGGLNQQLITAGYTLPQALELEKRHRERKSSLAKAERELYLELKTGREIKEGLVAERVKVQAEEQTKTMNNEHDWGIMERHRR
ncbi:MAG: relaxase/mobilization nuclease domain-containing protein [Lachnospiraceae bacterium]|nr:relaxase/mobilization nuclease domain-containing protein [Lachnospiraceae bacterium]